MYKRQGLNLEDLRTALTQASVNAAKGNFDGPHQDYQINANDQLVTSGDYRKVVVAYRNGAPIMPVSYTHLFWAELRFPVLEYR